MSGKLRNCVFHIFVFTSIIILPGCADNYSKRETLFDNGWRFYRDDAAGAQQPDLNDMTWRKIDLPHDYSIEDLPPMEIQEQQLSLSITEGIWNFSKGDDPNWKRPDYDDSKWQQVILPANWEKHSNYQGNNVYGWYRRKITIPEDLKGKDIQLGIGRIDDVDETFINGTKVGGLGSFPPNYVTAWTDNRQYNVPATLLKGNGTDVVAIRVFDGEGGGGLYAKSTPHVRSGLFDSKSEGGASAGFTVGGIGWYRKTFNLPNSLKGKKLSLIFEGVYMNCQIWLNGRQICEHPYGYTTFDIDITPYVHFGRQPNVLAVKVDTSGRHTRWYSGSGIYRHIWLKKTNPVYLDDWGIFVTTPRVSRENATIKVHSKIINESPSSQKVKLISYVVDDKNRKISSSYSSILINKGKSFESEQILSVKKPKLWSIDSPNLYNLICIIEENGRTVDKKQIPFGIRTIEFSAEGGFRLNGKTVELKGGCVHHDNGCLGACAYDRAEERRVELLKANGFNAIRTSHNPPSSAFLDACDRLGMVVIDEAFDCFNDGKNPNDYHLYFDKWWRSDVNSMVLRDRNHPSVIFWSVGNEVPLQATAKGAQITDMLTKYIRTLDPTRPVSQAFMPIGEWDSLFASFDKLDITGYNYKEDRYRIDHQKRPRQIIYCSESMPKDLYRHWMSTIQLPYVFGDFVWTAMDYLGEAGVGGAYYQNDPTPFSWPWTVAACGDLDLCGFKKAPSYYRDIVWGNRKIACFVHEPNPDGKKEEVAAWGWPQVYPSWTWPGQEGKELEVHVYSACPTTRLILNGEDLGIKKTNNSTQLKAVWKVSYQPGKLEAVGLDENGNEIARCELLTTGSPAALRLVPDKKVLEAGKQDLCYVTVEIIDDKGNICPNVDNLINFKLEGPAKIIGVCNGDPQSTESFQLPQRKAWHGRLLAVIKAGDNKGKVNLAASSEGLKTGTRELIIK